MILANFSSLNPGRGFEVGVSAEGPTGELLAPLLITAKASEMESSEGGLKERSSSSESSRQIVSGAGLQLELARALMGVLVLEAGTQAEVKGVQTLCSFFGLESYMKKRDVKIPFPNRTTGLWSCTELLQAVFLEDNFSMI